MVHKKCHKLFKHQCSGQSEHHSSESTPSTPGNTTREANGDVTIVSNNLLRTGTPKERNRKKYHLNSSTTGGPLSLQEADHSELGRSGQEVDANNDLLNGADSHQYSLRDFELLRVIGRGSYAKVLMVELKKTKRIYAMKVIKKELVTDDEDIDWVQTEKHVFETASNYPFLVGLHSCFQTSSRLVSEFIDRAFNVCQHCVSISLFFVIEFVRGGDLMFHMQRQRRLPEEHARFYAAEISLALNFLHERGIIYRDLKLDNVSDFISDSTHNSLCRFCSITKATSSWPTTGCARLSLPVCAVSHFFDWRKGFGWETQPALSAEHPITSLQKS